MSNITVPTGKTIVVYGKPRPQGSLRTLVPRRGSSPVIVPAWGLETKTAVWKPARCMCSAIGTACGGRRPEAFSEGPRTLLWREVMNDGAEILVQEELLTAFSKTAPEAAIRSS